MSGPAAALCGAPALTDPEACGLEAASGAFPVAAGAVGGAEGCELVLVDEDTPTEPPPWAPEFDACWGPLPADPDACGLEAASGAFPVATGAVGGAAACELVLVDEDAAIEPPP